VTVKTMLQKISILNKCCSLENAIYQRTLKQIIMVFYINDNESVS